MYHIYSTLTNTNEYVRYSEHGPQGINVAETSVVIKGGSGINQRHLHTPLGVHTAVSDADYEWLKDNFSFQQHMKNGYITVKKSEENPEVVAADMATRQWIRDATGNTIRGDAFPVTPEDFSGKETGNGLKPIEPKVNKKSKAA